MLIGFNVNDILNIIKDNYKWALEIDTNKPSENYYFWYTSNKVEPRLGITKKDAGIENNFHLILLTKLKKH